MPAAIREGLVVFLKFLLNTKHSRKFLKKLKRINIQPKLQEIEPFIDSENNVYVRYGGYRDMIVPRWPDMFKKSEYSLSIDHNKIENSRKKVVEIEKYLSFLIQM